MAVVSPTHKRTEGLAPVWGSEVTTKAATLQGGVSGNRSYAERKTVGSGGDWWWWHATSFLVQSPFRIYLNLREQFRNYPKEPISWSSEFFFSPLEPLDCEGQCAPSPRWAAKGQWACRQKSPPGRAPYRHYVPQPQAALQLFKPASSPPRRHCQRPQLVKGKSPQGSRVTV